MEFLSILCTVIFLLFFLIGEIVSDFLVPSLTLTKIKLKNQAEALMNTNAQSVQAAFEQSCPIPFVLL